jgi:hypothetical protein
MTGRAGSQSRRRRFQTGAAINFAKWQINILRCSICTGRVQLHQRLRPKNRIPIRAFRARFRATPMGRIHTRQRRAPRPAVSLSFHNRPQKRFWQMKTRTRLGRLGTEIRPRSRPASLVHKHRDRKLKGGLTPKARLSLQTKANLIVFDFHFPASSKKPSKPAALRADLCGLGNCLI